MLEDRYPTANVLGQRGHWDEATRKVILDRVHNVPGFTHFNEHQQKTLEALCDRIIPQLHREPPKRIPIAPWIDQQCANRVVGGFRFDDMPPNEVAWEWGLAGLDQTAQAQFQQDFADLEPAEQEDVLETIRTKQPPGDVWVRLPADRWWIFVALRQITGVYYSHPLAWDEIGFGGPAYPRGYFALNHGAPEPWEPREVPR